MKKIISIIVALAFILAVPACLAEKAASTPDLSNVQAPDYKSYIHPFEKSKDDSKGSFTTDRVTINGNEYKVVLPNNICMTYTAPDDAVCFTQDLVQQSSLFTYFYKNPMAVVSEWIDRQMHMNIYRPQTNVDIYIHVVETGLSAIFQNSNTLSDDDANYLLNYMMNTDGFFLGATDGTCGWLGGNVWFLGDMRQADGTVTLVSFVGGQEIFCYAAIQSDEQYQDMLNLLENLTITVA